MRRLAILLAFLVPGVALAQAKPDYPPLKADASGFGGRIQRTMRLLATSTKEKPNTVRILSYGQSITEQKWTPAVVADLKARFPHADIVSENRALGGFSSQLLVKTADTDLYPFAPDLLVFHVYGAHDKYADIIRRTRERTTAEILIQTDHVTKADAFTEETDPAKLPPKGTHWDAFMNHNWLPGVAKKYDCELCDQRRLWKVYLTENKLEPKALLSDAVHLNAHGEYLMGECVKAYMRYDEGAKPAADGWVADYPVAGGKAEVAFIGNRVDLILDGTADVSATIDGMKPADLPGGRVFTRAVAKPGGKWPVVAGFGGEKLIDETWSMTITRDPKNEKAYTFTLSGSVTGPDGDGRSDATFVSPSGRVKILPEHWNVEYALALAQVKPVPDTFAVTWKAVPNVLPPRTVGKRTVTNLIHGIANGKHTLTLDNLPAGGGIVRVYKPPLQETK